MCAPVFARCSRFGALALLHTRVEDDAAGDVVGDVVFRYIALLHELEEDVVGDVPGLAQLGERHVARRESRADLAVHVERVEPETERGAPVVGEELGVGVDVT